MSITPAGRIALAVSLAFLGTAVVRADIVKADVDKWAAEYKPDKDTVETQMASGKSPILADQQTKIELAARYYTAKIKFFKADNGVDIHRWFQEMEKLLAKGKDGEFHQAFLRIFATESVKIGGDILENPEPAATLQNQVNVLRYMAMLGEYGQDAVLPVLVKGLNLPNEGARYWAARGLQGLFAQAHRAEKPVNIQNKQLETEAIGKLVELMNNPDHIPEDAPEERQDGYRMLRREVIRALAQCRTPRVKVGTNDVLVALQLGRVVFGTPEISPLPRFDERVEAAVGLALMNPAAEGYQADYAAACIGNFVAEYATRYRRDKPKGFADSMADYGLKLAEALLPLRDAKDANDYRKKIAGMCIDMLGNMGGAKGDPGPLRNFLEDPSNRPPNGFYKQGSSALPDTMLPIKVPGEKFTAASEK